MASPNREDWINQGLEEVATVLRASTLIMDASALTGGTGIVKRVDVGLSDPSTVRGDRLPHANVVYLGDDPSEDGDTIGVTYYSLQVGIQFTGKGANWEALWQGLQKMRSRIPVVVSTENASGRFGGYSTQAKSLGGKPLEDEKDGSSYVGVIYTGIQLEVRLID